MINLSKIVIFVTVDCQRTFETFGETKAYVFSISNLFLFSWPDVSQRTDQSPLLRFWSKVSVTLLYQSLPHPSMMKDRLRGLLLTRLLTVACLDVYWNNSVYSVKLALKLKILKTDCNVSRASFFSSNLEDKTLSLLKSNNKSKKPLKQQTPTYIYEEQRQIYYSDDSANIPTKKKEWSYWHFA